MSRAAIDATQRSVPEGRDLTLDLTRVACVVLVVFVHVLFTGVGRAPDGSLLIERTVEQQPWFAAASWIANIMPLFFVVGGYAARAGWRSAAARGDTADTFIRVRIARLARPAVPLLVFFTATLGIARALPIDRELVDTVAIGVGSPLWFLAAYMVVQAAAPVMIRMHLRFGGLVLAVLLAGALAVDAFRFLLVGGLLGIDPLPPTGYGVGRELFGIPNIVFVWLFAQQVGFFLFDGWFSRRSRWQLLSMVALGYVALWALISVGGYSWSMLGNQWPPTAPMAVLAVVQASALTLLHRPLTALMHTRVAQGLVYVIGSRLMTVYLWHLPLIMVLTGVELLLPLPMPVPGSATWWWTRPLFLLIVLGAVWLLSLWLGRYEQAPPPGPARFPRRSATVTAVLMFAVPFIAITAYGLDFPLAAVALASTLAALFLSAAHRP
jgi:fucose 4-O-acetylase-like acetyltransferase